MLLGTRFASLSKSFIRISGLLSVFALMVVVLSVSAGAQTAHFSGTQQTLDFGTVNVGQTSSTASLTFTFDTGGALGAAPAVLTGGASGLDFADAGTGSCTVNGTTYGYNAGDTCTVDVRFAAKYPGARNGAVVLKDGSGNAIATAYVHGVGIGPMLTPSYTLSASPTALTIAAGSNGSVTLNLMSNGYAGTVSFTVASSDALLVTAPAPSPVVLTSGGTGTSTLTIYPTTSAEKRAPGMPWKSGGAVVMCALLVPLGVRRKRAMAVLLTALAITLVGLMMACGGGSSRGPRTYTMTVTPTGTGTVTNPAAVTITVTVP